MAPSQDSLEDSLHDREPPRVRLANQPTRGHWLRFGQTDRPREDDEKIKIWMKRDDQTGSELSGNKVRKLEYLLAEALEQDATHVITCGGEQSNHARATALAAAQLGLKSILILRTDDPESPPAPTGNILLDRLVGAELQWISRAAWRDRNQLLADAAERVRRGGDRPYVIPEGGSNGLGSWGYVRAMHELADDLRGIATPNHPVTVVFACGSGGTAAGLITGAKLLELDKRGIRVAGINVCDDRAYFVDAITRICGEMEARWQLGVNVSEADIDIVDGHVGRGYARSRPEELATIRDVCRTDGVVLDPVYTGKAFHGMLAEIARDPRRFGSAVAFLHTGGVYGLFAPSELASVL
ncbi:MAG TPA: D-cysteine desulfhydrase family protein [Kofleriaceae bacterium]|nr:D-cysteine desulfhydrase family protein [Kofleriaceae bacterium]